MKVAVPKETRLGELRVALVPQGVKALAKAGLEIVVETGAGATSGVSDTEYKEAGAEVVGSAAEALTGAGIVLRINPPSLSDPDEVSAIGAGTILVSFLNPLANQALVRRLAEERISSISMELVLSLIHI